MPSILIADDNTNIQKMVALAFQDRGIKVVSVGNGEAAVRRLPDLNPDIVLADIFMPVRNGYEVCEFVKKDQRFQHVPVILLVGAFDPLDEKEARRVGADGVLKKPFVPPDPLIAMVISALEKNPKVVAEMAAAKAALEPHSMHHAEVHVGVPVPAQASVAPPKFEPKPLPEFPEPTPEEEALLYGMGKGQRSLGTSGAAASELQPPAPAANETEEAFDGAATSSDWRRNTMDFEIPADVANTPAFSSDQGLEPVAPPTEAQSRPQSLSIPEPVEKKDSAPQTFLQRVKTALAGEPRILAAEPAQTPVVAPENKSELPASPPEAHWMDAIASPVQQSSGDWLTALPQPEPSGETSAPAESPAAHAPATVALATSEDDSFFADEPASSEPAPAPALDTFADEIWLAAESSSRSSAVSDPDVVADASEPEPSFVDPNLVQPQAVRVTPEPLLIDAEETQGSSDYLTQPQELTPLHTIQVPETPVSQVSAAEEPVPAESQPGIESERMEPEPVESARQEEASELIPTGPPPNREALSGIPFLTLPPGFDPNAPAEPETHAQAQAAMPTVDAIVQKVLEKLQPQLQDLLAQGVLKPLVENLLQQEVLKKEK